MPSSTPHGPPGGAADRLAAWAREEFGFVPSRGDGQDVFKRLCTGPMAARWSHMASRVRSRENAALVRANLVVERHRREMEGTLGLVESEEDAFERKELTEEIARLRQQLQKNREQESAARVSLQQQRQDAHQISQSLHEVRGKLAETRQLSQLLRLFAAKCNADIASVKQFRTLIRMEESDGLFSSGCGNDEEGGLGRLYTTGDGCSKELRTKAKHAAVEARKRCKESLLRLASEELSSPSMEEEERRGLSDSVRGLCRGVPVADLARALEGEAQDAAHAVAAMAEQIDVAAEAEQLRLDLEKSGVLVAPWNFRGELPAGGTDQLLLELARRHVEMDREAAADAEEAGKVARRAAAALEQLRTTLAETVSDEYVRDLVVWLVSLEAAVAKGEAMVAALRAGVERERGEARRRREEAARLLRDLQNDLEVARDRLAQTTSNVELLIHELGCHYSEEIAGLRRETEEIITKQLQPVSEELVKLLLPDGDDSASLRGKVSRQLKSVLSIPEFSEFQTTTVRGSKGPTLHQSNSLSIRRLECALAADVGRPSLAHSLMSALSLRRGAPSFLVLTSVLDAVFGAVAAETHERFLGGEAVLGQLAKTLQESDDLLGQLRGHFENQEGVLLPLLLDESKRLEEEGKRRHEKAVSAIQIWSQEPAQLCCAEDPDLTVCDMTLKKWQEKFRVALAKYQQMHR